MAISIRNPEVEALAREVAEELDINMTEAILRGLGKMKEEIDRSKGPDPVVYRRLKEIAAEFDSMPVLDDRSPEEILGYDEIGLPT